MLPTPRALLLDFGGVIADGAEAPDWPEVLAEAVNETLVAAGVAPVPAAAVLEPLLAEDRRSDRLWVTDSPAQSGHDWLWGDAIAAAWPPEARAVAVAQAAALSRRYLEAKHGRNWALRPGMAELLDDANRRGVPVAVVSNTLCGAAHRDFLDRVGVTEYFKAQFYSDEEGVRKPNPEFALRAVAAVGVEPGECWFVGDTLSRDVLVARRAGLGAAVLMRSLRAERPPHPDGAEPDVVVADPVELHTVLRTYWS